MPGKDGYETTKEIRSLMQDELLPQAIIVCVSGNAEKEYKEEAYNNGLNHCFVKPVQWEPLDKLVTVLNFPKSQYVTNN